MNFSLRDLFRLNFRFHTGRETYRTGDFFVKRYTNELEGVYEYNVLEKITDAHPISFRVPKVFKVYRDSSGFLIIMEKVKGTPLENYIVRYLLFEENRALKVFNGLGKALRELHYSPLKGLRKGFFPNSYQEIKLEIFNISRRLVALHVLSKKLMNTILDAVEETSSIDDEIFAEVNLHGEFYFTHIILSEGKYVFLDFHNACKGPAYFDLAMLSISLYVSITLPYLNPLRLTPLISTFLTGYYGKRLNEEMIKSIKLAELYVALREILTYSKALYDNSSLINKLSITLKIKRLKTAIKEVIIPTLTVYKAVGMKDRTIL
ncbi:MAG: aminoglycoside phosphotransferase family protein [Nitrososphaerota archaeon]